VNVCGVSGLKSQASKIRGGTAALVAPAPQTAAVRENAASMVSSVQSFTDADGAGHR
jgi:hypothetical protein